MSLIPGCVIGGEENPSNAIFEVNIKVSGWFGKQKKKQKKDELPARLELLTVASMIKFTMLYLRRRKGGIC